MKKLLILLFCVVVPLAMLASDGDEYIKVDWSPLFTDNVGWNIYTGDIVVGWNHTSDINTCMGHSMEIGWLNVIGAKYNSGHGQRITMGLGIDWHNYRLEKSSQFTKIGEDVVISNYPDGATSRLSRVKVFSLTLPVLVRQRLFNKVDIFAGPVLNFNLHASMLTQYTLDGEKIKETSNSIHQIPVTIDVMGGLKWRALGAYMRYSPCHVLKENYAPSFTPFTAGIFIGF